MVFDLDGVVFLGGRAIPGAGEALQRIADAGIRVVFATNNATRTTADIAARIAQTGFRAQADQVATSAAAAAWALESEDDPVLVVGEQGLEDTLTESGHRLTGDPDTARAVVVGLDRGIDYGKIRAASQAVRGGARFIATNTDVTFPTPEGPVPGAGAIVAAVAAAAGRDPEVVGKPHPPIIAVTRSLLGPGSTWMVGDRPETDLAAARAADWVPVLVLSGITRHPDEVPDALRPALTVASIADLADMMAQ